MTARADADAEATRRAEFAVESISLLRTARRLANGRVPTVTATTAYALWLSGRPQPLGEVAAGIAGASAGRVSATVALAVLRVLDLAPAGPLPEFWYARAYTAAHRAALEDVAAEVIAADATCDPHADTAEISPGETVEFRVDADGAVIDLRRLHPRRKAVRS